MRAVLYLFLIGLCRLLPLFKANAGAPQRRFICTKKSWFRLMDQK